MFSKTAIVALFAGLAAAQHAPVGEPNGNPITRPLNEIVPACKPFTITWTPTTPNTVSLILLRGPSTNVQPLQNIVVGIPNSGSFVWTPSGSLEADVTRYGIQLIDDITGQYQYSTQIGISIGPECANKPSSSSSVGYPVSTPSSSKGYPVSSPAPSSSSKPSNHTTIVTKTSSHILSSHVPSSNSTVLLPSRTPTASSSSAASGTTSSGLPQSTGAASSLQAGLSLAGVVAAFAFML